MEDWAIIIGITDYPGLSKLEGPETDAEDFYDWVTSKDWGKIAPDSNRARIIVTSKCQPAPPYQTVIAARPIDAMIQDIFAEIQDISKTNVTNKKGRQVGRRLYLYFAGHGFVPSDQGNAEGQVALLMANAAEDRYGHHISGTAWAQAFYRAGFFEEILLFMDCCRDYFPSIVANPVTIDAGLNNGNLVRKRFFAYATEWGKKSWERIMSDSHVHGVFTTTLMKGLRGAASDCYTGEITTSSLRSYLKGAMKFFFDPKDMNNAEVLKEPRVPDFGDPSFVIASVAIASIPKYQITVNTPAQFLNKDLELISGTGALMRIDNLPSVGPIINLELPRGGYTLKVKDQNWPESFKGFDVNGIGPENVTPK